MEPNFWRDAYPTLLSLFFGVGTFASAILSYYTALYLQKKNRLVDEQHALTELERQAATAQIAVKAVEMKAADPNITITTSEEKKAAAVAIIQSEDPTISHERADLLVESQVKELQ